MSSAVDYQGRVGRHHAQRLGLPVSSVDAGCEPPPSILAPAPVDPPPIRFVDRVRETLAARGPMTVRELSDVLGADMLRTNSALCNLKTQGDVAVVDQVPIVVKAFGPRLRAVYGLAREVTQ